MYCSKCGKQIDYEAEVCRECEAASANASFYNSEPAPQQTVYQQPNYQQPNYQQPNYQQPNYQQPMYGQPVYQQPMYTQPAVRTGPNPRMYGFGGALTSTILSFFAYIFWFVSIGMSAISYDLYYYGYGVSIGFTIIFTLITWGLSIPSIILGGSSIGKFKEAKRNGQPTPIATLILGISGLAMGALVLFCSFIVFIAFVSVY